MLEIRTCSRSGGAADGEEEFIICRPCTAEQESHSCPLVNQVRRKSSTFSRLWVCWKVQVKCDKTAAQLRLLPPDRRPEAFVSWRASIFPHFHLASPRSSTFWLFQQPVTFTIRVYKGFKDGNNYCTNVRVEIKSMSEYDKAVPNELFWGSAGQISHNAPGMAWDHCTQQHICGNPLLLSFAVLLHRAPLSRAQVSEM